MFDTGDEPQTGGIITDGEESESILTLREEGWEMMEDHFSDD